MSWEFLLSVAERHAPGMIIMAAFFWWWDMRRIKSGKMIDGDTAKKILEAALLTQEVEILRKDVAKLQKAHEDCERRCNELETVVAALKNGNGGR